MRKICFSTLQVSGRTYSYSLPDMAEAHKQSFFKFLNQGLTEELQQVFPIYLDKGRIQIVLEPESLTFEAPKLTLKEAFLQRTTYNISACFLVKFIDWEKNTCKKEWMNFGSIPICMSGGWFLVRGLRRIVLHQLIRSPGCYADIYDKDKLTEKLKKEFNSSNLEYNFLRSFTPNQQIGLNLLLDHSISKGLRKEKIATEELFTPVFNPVLNFELLLLPQQGTWLRFYCNPNYYKALITDQDKKKYFDSREKKNLDSSISDWSNTQPYYLPGEKNHLLDIESPLMVIQWGKRKEQRASIFIFLRAMGVHVDQIESFFNLKFRNGHLSSQKAFLLLGFVPAKNKHAKQKTPSRRAFYQRFFNYSNYRLGAIGRLRLNRRLGLCTPLNCQSLTPDDIFSFFNQLAALHTKFIEKDDIDHLQNKRLRSCGDFLQETFYNALKTNLKSFRSNLHDSLSIPPSTKTANDIKLYWGTENIHFNSSLFKTSNCPSLPAI